MQNKITLDDLKAHFNNFRLFIMLEDSLLDMHMSSEPNSSKNKSSINNSYTYKRNKSVTFSSITENGFCKNHLKLDHLEHKNEEIKVEVIEIDDGSNEFSEDETKNKLMNEEDFNQPAIIIEARKGIDKMINLIENPNWEEFDRKGDYVVYTMS